MNILSELKKIRLFVFDVDGVLTDGSVILLDDGQQARRMNIKDGYALQLAIKKGYEILVITGGTSEAVRMRLLKLGITKFYPGIKNKEELFLQFIEENNYLPNEVLYMGDDIPDLKCIMAAGIGCSPADAVPEIRAIARYISPYKGGEGCVRDVLEKVMKLNDHWSDDDEVASV
jgi:3-deoxy-D-manno-octulosonate 8-phosphate phosphatase (KDO 8-P phosphatase)